MDSTQIFSVSGMQCGGCETIIIDAVSKLPGIHSINVEYPKGKVTVTFDSAQTDIAQIQQRITAKGYTVNQVSSGKKPDWFLKFSISCFAIVVLISLMVWSRKLWHKISLPDLNSEMSVGMIFLVGLITGLHCIGMCGNFVLNYTVKDAQAGRSSYFSHVLYGIGKTVSYGIFGAVFGFLGSLFKITPFISGITAIVAGLFLIIFGLSMLDVFVAFKRIRIKQPEAMARFAVEQRKQTRSPFFIGFFSGFLLGCGPLQAMYVLAAGNGDAVEGAKFLTIFGLGTLPALIGFGMIARLLSNKMTKRFIQASGFILVTMGMMMLNKGLLRTQSGYDFQSVKAMVLSYDSPDKVNNLSHST